MVNATAYRSLFTAYCLLSKESSEELVSLELWADQLETAAGLELRFEFLAARLAALGWHLEAAAFWSALWLAYW